jgi:N-methylhydantoinase A
LLSAAGLLGANIRHIYLRSAVGMLENFPLARMMEIFAALEAEALADAREEAIAPAALSMRREIDLRYQHQGYQLAVLCPNRDLTEADRAALRAQFDASHQRVYGQSAPREPAEVVTFRVISEAAHAPWRPAPVPAADGSSPARARAGERELFSLDESRFVTARVFRRERLLPGDELEGPAIVEQFDSTGVVWPGQRARVDEAGTLIVETGAAR